MPALAASRAATSLIWAWVALTPTSPLKVRNQGDLGSRAWINPFTGVFSSTARDHTGHVHTATSHMLLVESNDLNTTMNPGATYYAELLYITPDEYAWCQTHPGECNMYNNASYLRYNVFGTTSFSFSAVGSPVRMTPAINAWTGATINPIEPEPGIDGRAFIAYKVTGPVAGVWHYEYALYNQNLDRGIQSFSVPLGCAITLSNLGFHAPLNHPGFPNDGTQGDAGFSNAAWTSNQTTDAVSWSSETFAQNQNANAIRWGTLYNFRFDSDKPPLATNATIGFSRRERQSPLRSWVRMPAMWHLHRPQRQRRRRHQPPHRRRRLRRPRCRLDWVAPHSHPTQFPFNRAIPWSGCGLLVATASHPAHRGNRTARLTRASKVFRLLSRTRSLRPAVFRIIAGSMEP